jgi:hypothetical protein
MKIMIKQKRPAENINCSYNLTIDIGNIKRLVLDRKLAKEKITFSIWITHNYIFGILIE